jgi:D-beta-D-heptose 7-phosphate kinase/D-beta-D-heptose 1-phosphate adenosyltransferase
MGAASSVLGVIGQDEAGRSLVEALKSEGACTDGLIAVDGRPTTRKTRVIAHSQQVVRVDHERRSPLARKTLDSLCTLIREVVPSSDAVLLSDYQKGVLVPEVLAATLAAAKDHGKPVTGNIKPSAISSHCALTVITLNLHEAGLFMGGRTLESDEDIVDAGKALLARTGAEHVLITRGAHGLDLFSKTDPGTPQHVPPRLVEVYDTAGAGDTVISTLTLALASGAAPIEAVTMANHAAAQAVKKLGVATVSREEILASFELDG